MIGVIVARFQTPYLHKGHINLINTIREKHSRCIVVLGVSQTKGTQRSPYDYFTREKMIKELFDDIYVLPLMDIYGERADEEWSKQLDLSLSGVMPGGDFALYGSRDSFIDHYSGKYSCEELKQVENFNASEIREMFKDKVGSSKDFRCGVLYNIYDRFPTSYQTVDIACFSTGKTEILLGKKPHSNQWRLPGGFVDPSDKSLEAAATRELREECGYNLETTPMRYILSRNIDDARYAGGTDCIKTALFACSHTFGFVEAQDDLEVVQYVAIAELPQMIANNQIVIEHLPLIDGALIFLRSISE